MAEDLDEGRMALMKERQWTPFPIRTAFRRRRRAARSIRHCLLVTRHSPLATGVCISTLIDTPMKY